MGIDLGGTNIKAAVCGSDGMVLGATTLPTKAEKGLDASIGQIHAVLGGLFASKRYRSMIGGIGIGVPGSVDHRLGRVLHPPNLPGWKNVPLARIVEERWRVPVRIENDANAAALGEAFFGAGRGTKNFIAVTLGTGIGGGIVMERKIVHGERGFAGELGHTTIDLNGPKCGCGSRGCIEAYIGSNYLVRRTLEKLKERPSSVLFKWMRMKGQELTPKEISRAANQGDVFAREILVEAGEYLGAALASAANLLDITTFIIGGGVAAAGKPLFEGIASAMKRRVLISLRRHITILPAELGNRAGFLGAAALWF